MTDTRTTAEAIAPSEWVVTAPVELAFRGEPVRVDDRLRVDPLATVRPGELVVALVSGGFRLCDAGEADPVDVVGVVVQMVRSFDLTPPGSRMGEIIRRALQAAL